MLTENTVFTHALVIRTVEDSINEQAVLMFLNSLSYRIWSFFWKKMAESVRLKCLFQTNQYTLSPFNLSLKYLSYFCLNYILQAVVTSSLHIHCNSSIIAVWRCFFRFVCVSVKQQSYFLFLVPDTSTVMVLNTLICINFCFLLCLYSTGLSPTSPSSSKWNVSIESSCF